MIHLLRRVYRGVPKPDDKRQVCLSAIWTSGTCFMSKSMRRFFFFFSFFGEDHFRVQSAVDSALEGVKWKSSLGDIWLIKYMPAMCHSR